MCARSSNARLINVCIGGTFLASMLLALAIYSSFRWIGDAGWLGARTPGLEWVPGTLGYVALLANLAGVAMSLIVFWKGNWKHRRLVGLPGLFLLGWLVYAALNVIDPGL